jgi:hypothetical protein
LVIVVLFVFNSAATWLNAVSNFKDFCSSFCVAAPRITADGLNTILKAARAGPGSCGGIMATRKYLEPDQNSVLNAVAKASAEEQAGKT